MRGEHNSLGEFEAPWSLDYSDPSVVGDVRSVLRDDWKRELLVLDYEQAASDARNRDRTLHNSIYVGLVLLGILVNALIRIDVGTDGELFIIVCLLGAALFGLLAVWSSNSRGARNASWDRRSEIEDMVKTVDGLVLRSNDSSFKRLQRRDAGEYALRSKGPLERWSVGNLAPRLNVLLSGMFVVLAVSVLY